MKPAPDALDLSLVPRRLADALAGDIVYGRLAPGSRVVEEEVGLRFGVSRSPVRESLRILEQDGLVVRSDRRGARVAPLNRRNLDEVYACRVALEGMATAEAALHRDEAGLLRLRAALGGLRRAYKATDISGYFEANVAFTAAIHQAAANGTLTGLLSALGKQALRYRYLAYSTFPELMSRSVEGNHEIVEAIEAREKDRGRALSEGLIQRSWNVIRDSVPE